MSRYPSYNYPYSHMGSLESTFLQGHRTYMRVPSRRPGELRFHLLNRSPGSPGHTLTELTVGPGRHVDARFLYGLLGSPTPNAVSVMYRDLRSLGCVP